MIMKARLLLTVLISALALASNARAQEATTTPAPTQMAAPAAASDEAPWQFGVTVPLWAPQINGDVTVRGRQANVDISFDKLKDHLDASFSLGLEVRKGDFGVYGDVGYMKFSAGGGSVSGDLKFVIADGGLSYVLLKKGEEHPFVLAGTAGVRYWYADTTIRVNLPGPGSFSGGKTYDLVDPVIGLRASQYLTQKFHLDFAGDIGGFDINNDTDFTWSAMGVATYDFAKWFSLSAGYKALALDESKGSGDNKHGLNLIFNGVLVLAQFNF